MNQRTFTLIVGIIFLFTRPAFSQEQGPVIGFVGNQTHEFHLVFEFGMEVFEDGKPLDERQIWTLLCNYPDLSDKSKTSCSLETKSFYRGKSSPSSIVTADSYSTDENIRIKQADWKAGKLDFSIGFPLEGSTTEVSMLMTYDKDFIYLKSFRALNVGKAIGSDKLTVMEYRVPAYTYTVDYPIAIKGMKSEDDKARDEFLQTLTEADRVLWLKTGDQVFNSAEAERVMRAVLPDYDAVQSGKKKATDADWTKIRAALNGEFEKRLQTTGISADGQKKILAFITKGLADTFK